MENNGKRLESIRVIVDKVLLAMNQSDKRRYAYCHAYGVSQVCAMLALKRGLSSELAAIAGMVHDIYAFRTGSYDNHAESGAEMIRPILRDMDIFTAEERRIIVSAVFHHSDKQKVHGPYDEVLKDADILQPFLYNPERKVFQLAKTRLDSILSELGISAQFETAEWGEEISERTDKRAKLADIAEALASKDVEGIEGDADYRAICSAWPDENTYKALRNEWCAAFVYHCCLKAGFLLPIRHPLCKHRFAGVGEWLEWACLPEVSFFHPVGEVGFVPTRGDIVVYEKLLSDDSHDHIGIVLSVSDGEMTVAEGNVDNENFSGVLERSDREHINGFIRIDNGFKYESHGEFNWDI